MSAELWWRVEGARREWLRGREQHVQSGEARVRYRALGELRGEAEVGGGPAAWGWLAGGGVEFGLYSTGSTGKPSEWILAVEIVCDFIPLVPASAASVCRPSIPPPAPGVSVVPISRTVAHGQIDSKLATAVRWTGVS